MRPEGVSTNAQERTAFHREIRRAIFNEYPAGSIVPVLIVQATAIFNTQVVQQNTVPAADNHRHSGNPLQRDVGNFQFLHRIGKNSVAVMEFGKGPIRGRQSTATTEKLTISFNGKAFQADLFALRNNGRFTLKIGCKVDSCAVFMTTQSDVETIYNHGRMEFQNPFGKFSQAFRENRSAQSEQQELYPYFNEHSASGGLLRPASTV